MRCLLLAPSLDQGPESVPLCHICSRLRVICGLRLNPVGGFSNTGCPASQWGSWLILQNPLFHLVLQLRRSGWGLETHFGVFEM